MIERGAKRDQTITGNASIGALHRRNIAKGRRESNDPPVSDPNAIIAISAATAAADPPEDLLEQGKDPRGYVSFAMLSTRKKSPWQTHQGLFSQE